MPSHVSETENVATFDLAEAQRVAQTHKLAAAAWTEMQGHGIVPTPRNYDLWFTYL